MAYEPPNCVFPGWELAVVGVWEGGAGHGLLLCHFHRQLHGSELRQAPAAAEALRWENQVMSKALQTSKWLFPLLPLRARPSPFPLGHSHLQLDNKPHPPPPPIHSQRLTTQKQGTICWCVCAFEDVCAVWCLSLFRFCSSSSHLTLGVSVRSAIGFIADLMLLCWINPFIDLRCKAAVRWWLLCPSDAMPYARRGGLTSIEYSSWLNLIFI